MKVTIRNIENNGSFVMSYTAALTYLLERYKIAKQCIEESKENSIVYALKLYDGDFIKEIHLFNLNSAGINNYQFTLKYNDSNFTNAQLCMVNKCCN